VSKQIFGVPGRDTKDGRFLTRSAKANGLVFTTLHHGFDPSDYDPTIESGTLPEDLPTQTTFALTELGKVLAEAGSSLENVVRTTIFVNSPDGDAVEQANAAAVEFFAANGIVRAPAFATWRGELVDSGVAADMVATVPGDSVSRTGGFLRIPPQSGAGGGVGTSEQTEACLSRILAVLEANGSRLDKLVKVQVFMADIGEKHGLYNPTYNEFFHSRGILQKPARSTLGVELDPGELIRMEAIAYE
jgi:2-iminobutanoate/2-iminopropanoate deaminase